jgi:hypothetical protein
MDGITLNDIIFNISFKVKNKYYTNHAQTFSERLFFSKINLVLTVIIHSYLEGIC